MIHFTVIHGFINIIPTFHAFFLIHQIRIFGGISDIEEVFTMVLLVVILKQTRENSKAKYL